ncbi:MAG: DsbA family protein [Acidobacteriaceae bacterium]
MLVLAVTSLMVLPAFAQFSNSAPVGNMSLLKPPPGVRVAIIEFADLECPACARAYPIVHDAVAKYKIPLLYHDFPLPMHNWSFQAAVNARYLLEKDPKLVDEYRGAVFAAQQSIASKDDLLHFTQKWAQNHGVIWPFVVDPQGQLTAKVNADRDLGRRMNITETPTIWVVTDKRYVHVTDITKLYQTIDQALASTSAEVKRTSARR